MLSSGTHGGVVAAGREAQAPPGRGTLQRMCRSIKPLRRAETETTTGEIEAAALQFVRKVSNYRTPSARNAEAFEVAVAEIAEASRRMLETLGVEVVDGPNRWTQGSGTPRAHAHPHSTAG